MLDSLRQASTGWTAKILLALLILSFAVWGVSGSIFGRDTLTVARVGNTSVSAFDFRFAYENQLNTLQRQLNRPMTRQQADQLGLRQNVLSQVISGAVLDENTRKMGLGIPDDALAQEIANDPAFQDLSGNFSRSTLRAVLRNSQISENEYIESRKQVGLRNQLVEGTAAALSLPGALEDAINVYRNEKRVFDYVVIGPEVVVEEPVPQDSDLEAFYEDNKSRYRAPEYRKIDIVRLTPENVAKPGEVTSEEIEAMYENRKDNLRTPERRAVRQLVFANGEEAQAARARLDTGLSLDALAEELDKTIIDLGLSTREALPGDDLGEAAFAAELNEPTDVVEGLFGPVILEITEIRPEATTEFEAVQDQLRQEIALQRAGDEVFALFDAIEDERGAGVALGEAARVAGVESITIDAIDRRGLDKAGNPAGDFQNLRELAQAAFQNEPGGDPQPIELGSNGFLWFDVLEIEEDRQKELDEVRDDVRQSWINARIEEQVEAKANAIAGDLRAGENFQSVVAKQLQADSLGNTQQVSTSEPLTRTDVGDGNDALAQAAVAAGFNAPQGSIEIAAAGELERIVLRVKEIQRGDVDPLSEEALAQLTGNATQDLLAQMVQDLEARESVEINPAAIEAAFNPGGPGPLPY